VLRESDAARERDTVGVEEYYKVYGDVVLTGPPDGNGDITSISQDMVDHFAAMEIPRLSVAQWGEPEIPEPIISDWPEPEPPGFGIESPTSVTNRTGSPALVSGGLPVDVLQGTRPYPGEPSDTGQVQSE
jgi:hypothetical protein